MDPSKNPDGELAYGAGQIDPNAAADPHLIYDAGVHDYIQMLCSAGYSNDAIRLISGGTSGCDKKPYAAAKDLNYPSMAFQVTPNTRFSVTFARTVTNVGAANTTFAANIVPLRGNIKIVVTPDKLSFASLQEKQSFVVTVSSEEGIAPNEFASASVSWFDGLHSVTSPVVIHSGYAEQVPGSRILLIK